MAVTAAALQGAAAAQNPAYRLASHFSGDTATPKARSLLGWPTDRTLLNASFASRALMPID